MTLKSIFSFSDSFSSDDSDPTVVPTSSDPTASDPTASLGGAGTPIQITTPPTIHNTASLLWGWKWNVSGGNLTYSFPTASSQYGYNTTDTQNFTALDANQISHVKRALTQISSFTNLKFTQITETANTHANLRFGNNTSGSLNTAHAYPVGDPQFLQAQWGDVWYGGTGQNPKIGSFDNGQATMHEIGHALGLKHGQDNFSFGVMDANKLDIEYSDMNYPNYIGSTEGYATAGPGSSEQTYQMYDIAALQFLYGANFGKVGTSETYTWDSSTGEEKINGASVAGMGAPEQTLTNGKGAVFDTVWTAGSTSTYNLSNFNTNGLLDLRPGNGLLFSSAQRADLGYYGTPGAGVKMATYNVYNALTYNGDTRSEIKNLITGNGNNTVYGNDVYNTISLGSGSDTVYMGGAGGVVAGGSGTDILISGAGGTNYFYGAAGTDYFVGNTLSTSYAYYTGSADQFAMGASGGWIWINDAVGTQGTDALYGMQGIYWAGSYNAPAYNVGNYGNNGAYSWATSSAGYQGTAWAGLSSYFGAKDLDGSSIIGYVVYDTSAYRLYSASTGWVAAGTYTYVSASDLNSIYHYGSGSFGGGTDTAYIIPYSADGRLGSYTYQSFTDYAAGISPGESTTASASSLTALAQALAVTAHA